jgi:hypothetical protein
MAGEHEFWLDLYNLASLVDDEAPCPARIEQLADAFWDYPEIVQHGLRNHCHLLSYVFRELEAKLNADIQAGG